MNVPLVTQKVQKTVEQLLVIHKCQPSGRSRTLIEVPQAQSTSFDPEVQQTVGHPLVQHSDRIIDDVPL